MKVCTEQREDAILFAEHALCLSFPRDTTTWLASRFYNGKLAGVAVFTEPCFGNSSLHVAGNSSLWFTPDFCSRMFEHAFCKLKLSRLTATIAAQNVPCVKLALNVGFTLEGRLKGFTFGELLIFGMVRGACKWVS